jgi:Helicase HerA, central domain
MPTYTLDKVQINQLLGQVNNNWTAVKFVGLFSSSKKELLVESLTRLHNFNINLAKEETITEITNFKPSFSYVINGDEMKENDLNSIVDIINTFDFKGKVRLKIDIRSGQAWKNKLVGQDTQKKTVNKDYSSYSLVDMFNNFSSSKQPQKRDILRLSSNECFSVSILAESDTEEAYQFLSAFRGENNRVVKKGLFGMPKILITKDEIIKCLDLKNYQKIETKQINRPILLGTTRNGGKMEISMDRIEEHLKIEGLTRSGKSGAMIKIITELINENKRILLIDPHDSTTNEAIRRAKNIDNVVVLYPRNRDTDRYLGMNPLICLKDMRQRDEHIENLVYAFFSQEAESRQLSTLEAGRDLITAGVQFNYEYLAYLRKQGLDDLKVVEIMKEKQLTLNDLGRFNSDERLRQLLNEVLRKNNPSLARKILDPKEFNAQGLNACITRFNEATSGTGEIFFETKGFNPLEQLLENKTVFCNMKEIKPISRAIINKIVFSGLAGLHEERAIKGKTYFMVDEGASAKIPKLLEIITESNKFDLHIMLAYQSVDMWKGADSQEAIRLIPNLLEFDLPSNPKEKREFEAKTRDYRDNPLRGFTNDYDPIIRDFKLPSVGQTYEEVKGKIKQKEYNIYDYFLKNIK